MNNTNHSKFKKALINGTVTATKYTAGTVHVGLKYAMDATEIIEANIISRLTGEEKQDIRIARRVQTLKTQDQYRMMAESVFGSLKETKDKAHKRAMDLAQDIAAFNKVSSEV